MAAKHIDAFKTAHESHMNAQNTIINAKKQALLSILNDLKPLVQRMKDIQDTYVEVKRINKEYADNVLWKYLCNYNRWLAVNSHFGVTSARTTEGAYINRITITPLGLAIFYDPITENKTDNWDAVQWKGDNAESLIKGRVLPEHVIDLYLYSAEKLMENFPAFEKGFYELVENPTFS